ncbi:MAG: hypothetical protein MUO76_08045, partial [Anaerolineaceae bacterium]|nr:hypothetical protein [Anaerolineaceae bacterium]
MSKRKQFQLDKRSRLQKISKPSLLEIDTKKEITHRKTIQPVSDSLGVGKGKDQPLNMDRANLVQSMLAIQSTIGNRASQQLIRKLQPSPSSSEADLH